MKIIILGGGAAGFFSALSAKAHHPDCQVILIEKSAQLLSKVRVSGGGRCNVTHSCFDPKKLSLNYPRGGKELIGPFHQFQPQDTIDWFAERGVILKTEPDGRMFPITDNSSTIIDCLFQEAKKIGVEIRTVQRVAAIEKGFKILFKDGHEETCDRLILATGSSSEGHAMAASLGHSIVKPVPSLFTFNIPDFTLVEIAGVAVKAKISLDDSNLSQEGPLLITHWGFSGPAALKLSAWGARYLNEKEYQVTLHIDWLPDLSFKTVQELLQQSKKVITLSKELSLPKSLWKKLLERAKIDPDSLALSKSNIEAMCQVLKRDAYQVSGKTTHKEEFVTCGGVSLAEINFKTMESKLCEGLFFTGEVLDIDGVTGGFNFQGAWTTGWIAGKNVL